MISTTTDSLSRGWAIDDEVIRLRRWGTDVVYPLPAGDLRRLAVGAAPSCAIQVHDSSGFTSREHASLERVDGRWCIADRSKNGLYLDDQPRERCPLAPGVEIGLGRHVTLIAESARSAAVRAALARMIGWSAARTGSIDLALRMLRMAAARRAIFVLCGEPYLVPLAEELHRLAMTEQRPFVLCHPRRHPSADTERFTRCVAEGLIALAQAGDGTVGIDDRRRPADLVEMLDRWRRPEAAAQLMVLAKNPRKAEAYTPAPVEIPPLRTRRDELDRLIAEYEAEAMQRLAIEAPELTPAQRAWVRQSSGETLPDIQKATLRLIAIRQAGTIAGGAALLGMSHVALGQWLSDAATDRTSGPERSQGAEGYFSVPCSNSSDSVTLSAFAIPTSVATVGFVRAPSMSCQCFSSSFAISAASSCVSSRSSRSARTRFPRRLSARDTPGASRADDRQVPDRSLEGHRAMGATVDLAPDRIHRTSPIIAAGEGGGIAQLTTP
jgi:hypothetical protein